MNSRRSAAFQLLGLPAGSDRQAVAHAFRRLARSTHPDLSSDPAAAERFATLVAAYRLLLSETGGPPPDTAPASGTAHTAASSAPRVAAYTWQERGRAGGPPTPGPAPVGVPVRAWPRPPIVAGPVRVRPSCPVPDGSVPAPASGEDGA